MAKKASRADLLAVAAPIADIEGLCFVHLTDDGPPSYALLTAERYRDLVDRVFGGEEIPVDDREWRHAHVSPDMLDLGREK